MKREKRKEIRLEMIVRFMQDGIVRGGSYSIENGIISGERC